MLTQPYPFLFPRSFLPFRPRDRFPELRFATFLGVGYMVLPYLLSSARSWSSAGLMISACVYYMLFLPTINAYFFAYSVARLNDLSWGT